MDTFYTISHGDHFINARRLARFAIIREELTSPSLPHEVFTSLRGIKQILGGLAFWTSSSGRIEFTMSRKIARACSHSGACDADVAKALKNPRLAVQLRRVSAINLRTELAEYGAWDDAELANHADNLARLVWCAANDINESDAS